MAKRLRELADEHSNVVAVVGKDHVEGLFSSRYICLLHSSGTLNGYLTLGFRMQA